MRRTVSVIMLILLSVTILSLVFRFQLTVKSNSGDLFYDDFEGTEVNTEKWVVQENTNMSGYSAYGGSIVVADSYIFLTSDGSSFPCVYSAINPFPVAGDFVLDFDLTYTRVTNQGSGFWVSNGPFEPSEEPQANVLQVWMDGWGLRVWLLGELTYNSEGSTNTLIFKLEYSEGIYTVYMNNITIASTSSQLRPDTIGFGHPLASWVPFPNAYHWSSFKIDSVRMFEPHPTIISILTSASSTYVGFWVDINGTLTDLEGAPVSDATIILAYLIPGVQTWTPITSVTTGSEGSFSATWIPTATGSFTIKAEWIGNATHSGTYDVKNLSVLKYVGESLFFTESNSTLSSLFFNSTANELTFTVSGPSGTIGYSRVLISKTLVANINDFKVYVDEQQTEYSAVPTDDSWLLYFTYTHSTHDIMIAVPEFPLFIMLLLFMIATLLAAIVYRRKQPSSFGR